MENTALAGHSELNTALDRVGIGRQIWGTLEFPALELPELPLPRGGIQRVAAPTLKSIFFPKMSEFGVLGMV